MENLEKITREEAAVLYHKDIEKSKRKAILTGLLSAAAFGIDKTTVLNELSTTVMYVVGCASVIFSIYSIKSGFKLAEEYISSPKFYLARYHQKQIKDLGQKQREHSHHLNQQYPINKITTLH